MTNKINETALIEIIEKGLRISNTTHLVIRSQRRDNDVVAYGPFSNSHEAQEYMLMLAEHIETDMFHLNIITLNAPDSI